MHVWFSAWLIACGLSAPAWAQPTPPGPADAGHAPAPAATQPATTRPSPPPTTAPTGPLNADTLRKRVEHLWDARVGDDCRTLFGYEDPPIQAATDVDRFCEWYRKEDPLKIHSYTLKEVLHEGEFGWAQINYRSSVRRLPNIPPRDAQMWQKWRAMDGAWFPVPGSDLAEYPESPARRDATAEKKLRARFDEAVEHRKSQNWPKLYETCDPADRATLPLEKFAETEALVTCLTADVKWVEVIGAIGKVRVAYMTRLNDPHQTKLEPQLMEITERWILHEGEWYRDLKRDAAKKEK